MKIDAVIEKIRELVKESHTDDILTRLHIQEQISGYLIFLQEEEFNFLEAYKRAYTERKIAESEYIHKSVDTITKAKESAAYANQEKRDAETDMEVGYERLKMFRLSIKDHLENMRQRTSYLRYEIELVRNQ